MKFRVLSCYQGDVDDGRVQVSVGVCVVVAGGNCSSKNGVIVVGSNKSSINVAIRYLFPFKTNNRKNFHENPMVSTVQQQKE